MFSSENPLDRDTQIPTDAEHFVANPGHTSKLQNSAGLVEENDLIPVFNINEYDNRNDKPVVLYSKIPVERLATFATRSPEVMFEITNMLLQELIQFDPERSLNFIEENLNAENIRRREAAVKRLALLKEELLFHTSQLKAAQEYYVKASQSLDNKPEFQNFQKDVTMPNTSPQVLTLAALVNKLEEQIKTIKDITDSNSVFTQRLKNLKITRS